MSLRFSPSLGVTLCVMNNKTPKRLRIATAATTIFATLGLSLFATSEARACSCYWPDGYTYADGFNSTQEVVLGKALLSFNVGEKSYTAFKPQLDAKGCISHEHNTIWIESSIYGSECGVSLDAGEQYILHLQGKGSRGTYPIGQCNFHKKLSALSAEEMEHTFAQDPQCGDDGMPPFGIPAISGL